MIDLQTQIAERVAMALDIALLAPERKAIGGRLTDNVEAYDYFLRGNEYFVARLELEGAEAGLVFLPRALTGMTFGCSTDVFC